MQDPTQTREILIERLANFYMGDKPESLLTREVRALVPPRKELFLASEAAEMLRNDPPQRRHQLAYIESLPLGDDGWPLLAAMIEVELVLRKRRMELGLPYFQDDLND